MQMHDAICLAEEFARKLHQNPEASFQEFYATQLVKEQIQEAKLTEIAWGGKTGAVSFLDAGREKTILLRADLDAVPTENGPVHLCGHDHHTAALLGAMRYLAAYRDTLPCNVIFLFQPAEETTQGAASMLEGGLFNCLPVKPEAAFGIHNRPELLVGTVAVHKGALMAEKNEFEVVFSGKSGHAGEPEHCIDPLLCGAAFTQAVSSLTGAEISPMEHAVCKILGFYSGNPENDPPEEARLTGTLRSLSHEVQKKLMTRVEELAAMTAKMYHTIANVKWSTHVPLLYNDEILSSAAKKAAYQTVGEDKTVDTVPSLGSDDFAFFGEKVPAFYYWVGSGEADRQNACWHERDFHVADGYQKIAVVLLVNTVMVYGKQ